MVFPIIPVLSAVVGIAGTVSSISAQQRQANQQNAAIAAQISGNRRSEEIRQASNKFQEFIIKDQARLESLARKQAYLQQQRQLNEAAVQEAITAENEMTANNQQNYAAQAQASQQRQNLDAQARDVRRGAYESGTTARQQAAQQTAGAAQGALQNALQLAQANTQARSGYAQLAAMGGLGGSRTADTLRVNRQIENAALQSTQDARQVAYSAVRGIQEADRLAAVGMEVANLQRGIEEQSISANLASVGGMTEAANRLRAAQSVAFAEQAAYSSRANRLQHQIGRRQARLDQLMAKAGLVTGYQLSAAQAAQERAQLASQQVSGPGFISSAAQMLSAATPLMQILGNQGGGVMSPMFPQYGSPGSSSTTTMLGNNAGNFISNYSSRMGGGTTTMLGNNAGNFIGRTATDYQMQNLRAAPNNMPVIPYNQRQDVYRSNIG